MEAAESAWLIANNPPLFDGQGSWQQVLSCVGGEGCVGGIVASALNYIATQSVLNDSEWTVAAVSCAPSLSRPRPPYAAAGLMTRRALPYACANGCAQQPACPKALTPPFFTINSTCCCASWSETAMQVFVAKVRTELGRD